VVWPVVLDTEEGGMDRRALHGGRPVLSSVKYAANVWVHAYAYDVAHQWGCIY